MYFWLRRIDMIYFWSISQILRLFEVIFILFYLFLHFCRYPSCFALFGHLGCKSYLFSQLTFWRLLLQRLVNTYNIYRTHHLGILFRRTISETIFLSDDIFEMKLLLIDSLPLVMTYHY